MKAKGKSKEKSTGERERSFTKGKGCSGTRQAETIREYLPERRGGGTEEPKEMSVQGDY